MRRGRVQSVSREVYSMRLGRAHSRRPCKRDPGDLLLIRFLTIASAIALAACATSASEPVRESIDADVAMSEWTRSGHVFLDLRTGRYVLDPQPPRVPREAAAPPTRRGRLGSAELANIRAAFEKAVTQGLIEPSCASGGPPPRIVVGNGGTPMLVLNSRHGTMAAHGNRGCWNEAAERLHRALEARFGPEARPPRH
jgi:hypothetical protein